MVQPHRASRIFPISIKGVVVHENKVLLLKNEREEWELPGGGIEAGETPQECVARELFEETQCSVRVGELLDTWMYYIEVVDKNVFIVTYGCYPIGNFQPRLSHEHKEIGLFTEAEVATLTMPAGYQRSITTWFKQLSSQ